MAYTVTVATPGPQGATGLVFEGLWVSGTVYQFRDLVRESNGNLYFCTGGHTASASNRPSTDLTYWNLFLASSDAIDWASKAMGSLVTDQTGLSGYSSLHYATKSQHWAHLTTDLYSEGGSGPFQVKNDTGLNDLGFSAKEHAIGYQGAVGTATTGGSAKNWAQQSISNSDASGVTGAASGSFSAKVYAQALETGTGTYGGSAKGWAQNAGSVPGATANDRSSKDWAQGGSMTGATLGGSSKDWAQLTTSNVDGTNFSSKEHAVGAQSGTGGSSKNWAQQTGAQVTGTSTSTDASAKEWAVGTSTHKGDASAKSYSTANQYSVVPGTSVYSAKHYAAQAQEWSEKTTGQVRNDDNSADVGYSAKEWATDTNADIGSAQDWASKAGSAQVASTDYSSKAYAQDTANNIGSSKDWAVKSAAQVASTDYSSKEWATGTTALSSKSYAVGGAGVDTGDGSAKDWATKTSGTVGNTAFRGAKYYSEQAALSSSGASGVSIAMAVALG